MDKLKRALGKKPDPDDDNGSEEIAKEFPVEPLESCENCTTHLPSTFSIDSEAKLFNSAPKTMAQILVATDQTNWKHDIGEEPEPWGQVCKVLGDASDSLGELVGGTLRVNGTDLCLDDEDKVAEGKVLVVVLPQFLQLVTDAEHAVEHVKQVLEVKPGGRIPPFGSVVPDKGFILLCSHRTRDKRCGISAPLLKKELDMELRQHHLYRDPLDDTPGGVRVVFCNHVGGHKFAANVMVYQNTGMAVMMARMRPEHAHSIVERTILNGAVFPSYVRNCAKLQAYEW